MPKYTPNLNIQLADPATDGNQTFNIDTMINDPVEKLDEALGLVPVSGDVRAATTGNIVLSGVQTIDGIALAAGNRVLVKNQTAGKENGIYTVAAEAWTRTEDANSTAKLAAGIHVYVEEGTANGKTRWQMANTGAVILGTTAITFEKTGGSGSATDVVIGSRTVSDSAAPTGDSGTVTTLFGWLANMVKAITGGATWRTLPGMSIAAIKAVLDAATNAATASTLMKRDASGRAQVAAPSAAGDIARKDTVDGAITAHKAEADPHTGYVKKSGDTMTDALSVPALEVKSVAPLVVLTETDNSDKRWYMVADGGGLTFRENSLGSSYMSLNGGNVRIKNDTQILVSATVNDLVYYVRTDGNDNNTGTANTAAGAFKTIGKAISMIPQIVNHNVTINVGAGTYPETVYLSGYHGGGSISLIGDSTASTSRTIQRLIIFGCSCYVLAHGFNTTVTDVSGITVINCNRVLCNYFRIIVVGDPGSSGVAADFSNLDIQNSIISNRYYAISAGTGTRLFSQNNTGTGNTFAFSACGSTLHYNGLYPQSSDGAAVIAGGMIIPAVGVINPWGDNTYANRDSFTVTTLSTGSQQLTTLNTWYKIAYNVGRSDNFNSFNPSTWQFTPKKNGRYLFQANVGFSNLNTGNTVSMGLYRNNALLCFMGDVTAANSSGYFTVRGTVEVTVTAGDVFDIRCICYNQAGVAVDMNPLTSFWSGTQIA